MTTLSQILDGNCALVFLDADADPTGRMPTGMTISCSKKIYEVYFQVNNSKDFEYVNSYPVHLYSLSDKFQDILEGGAKLAELINEGKVSL